MGLPLCECALVSCAWCKGTTKGLADFLGYAYFETYQFAGSLPKFRARPSSSPSSQKTIDKSAHVDVSSNGCVFVERAPLVFWVSCRETKGTPKGASPKPPGKIASPWGSLANNGQGLKGRFGDRDVEVPNSYSETTQIWLWLKNMYQNGTLVNGTED